jgi:hypothetical protein
MGIELDELVKKDKGLSRRKPVDCHDYDNMDYIDKE